MPALRSPVNREHRAGRSEQSLGFTRSDPAENQRDPLRTDARADPGQSRSPGAGSTYRLGTLARRAITLAVVMAAGTTIVFTVPSLGSVRHDLATIDPWWVVAAVGLEIASCVSFLPLVGAFFDEIPGPLARRVGWIEEGSGALLPGGGVTSYALGGVFLHRAGMRTRRIVTRSGGVFWFTTAVNALVLLLGALLLLLRLAPGPTDFLRAGLPLVIVAPLTLAVAAVPRLLPHGNEQTRAHPWLVGLVDGVSDAWRAARHPSWRLLGAIGYLCFDMAVLFCLFRGLGYHVSCGVLIVAYLIGYLAAIIPVPGGIGVLEGGLAGALVLYGAPAATSAAAVLVYHAIAFWVPSLGGLGAWADLTLRHFAPKTPPFPEPPKDPPAMSGVR